MNYIFKKYINIRKQNKIIQFIFVYCAFAVFAEIGRFLIVPPGQASIIWPAAGFSIAAVYILGYRVALAIFLGAITNSLRHYSDINIHEILIAIGIGIGTTAQAVLATFFIKKIYKEKTLLGNLKDTIVFMVIAGPLACVMSAAIASITLLQAGIIPQGELVDHILSWWIGDVFGVVVFGPICMIALSKKTDENGLTLKRRLLVGIPMIISLFIFVSLLNIFIDSAYQKSFQEYSKKSQSAIKDFKKDLAVDISHLIAIEAFFNASEFVSDKEFENFTRPLLEDSKSVFGLSWIPKIKKDERTIFENNIREQGYPDFTIMDNSNDQSIHTSDQKNVYFPISYVRPYKQNKIAHGYDVYNISNKYGKKRREILDEAKDTGMARATSRFPIVQKKDEYGFIIYNPIYSKQKLTSKADRLKYHIGYISGIFTLPNLLKDLSKRSQNLDSDLIVFELDTLENKVLYDSRTKDLKESKELDYIFTTKIQYSSVLNVAGKKWRIIFAPKNILPMTDFRKTLWLYAIGGIIFNIFFLIVLITLTARNDYIEKLVTQRTNDLKQANEELEEFTYRTSHDLRSPLLSCIKIADLTKTYLDKGQIDEAKQAINISTDSLKKLELLVSGIFSLTATKNFEEEKQKINIDILLMEVLEKINFMDGFDNVQIKKQLNFQEYLYLKKTRIQSIVENFISNAVKYKDTNKDNSYIIITTKTEDNNFIISVEDNGLGIPKQYQHNLFTMFKRFHPSTAYGSGLGLYTANKSAKVLGGKILFEDTGMGSKFILSIPLKHTKR